MAMNSKRSALRTGLPPLAIALALSAGFLSGCGGESDREAAGSSETGAALLVKPLPDLTLPSLGELQDLVVKLNTGYMSLRSADHERALDYFQQVQQLYPDAAMPYVHLAVGLAAAGEHAEAVRALQKAADRGFKDIYMLLNDPIMDPLEALPDWPAFERQLRDAYAAARPANLASYQALDPDREPSFASFEELKQHYDSVKTHRSQIAMLYPADQVQLLLWDALNHKLAGLAKHANQTTDPNERNRIASETMTTAMEYENSHQTPWLRATVEMLDQQTQAFLEQFAGDSLSSSEVTYARNRAFWYGQKPREDTQLTPALVATGVEYMTKTDQAYPGSRGALMGLMDALNLTGTFYGLGSPQTEPLVRRIQAGYADNPFLRQLGYQFQPHVLALDGMPAFSVTDLDGREWHSLQHEATLMLIDFWATWCAPCRQEIPTLVRLYETYHDKGFEIIGISLDKAQIVSEEDLKAFAAEHGMIWPLVYDKQEWQSPAVRACGVTAIPFPILLDREGQVIAAAESATGKRLVALVEERLGGE